MKKLLTIAGSDSSGGAGIQADLKTFSAHLTYGMSVITALTAQNTTGVIEIQNASESMVINQLDAVFQDIFPDAVKVGMLPDKNIIKIVADKIKEYRPEFIVLDPVMVSTSGHTLMGKESIDTLKNELFGLCSIVTPNIPEAELLTGLSINNKDDMIKAGRMISDNFGISVLIKGGHLTEDATDILIHENQVFCFEGKKIDNPNTHGTGCTLSSSIAANLANGYSLPESVKRAKEYVSKAIESGLDLGRGRGPLNHLYSFINK